MSGAAPDLIAGYLEELCAGLNHAGEVSKRRAEPARRSGGP